MQETSKQSTAFGIRAKQVKNLLFIIIRELWERLKLFTSTSRRRRLDSKFQDLDEAEIGYVKKYSKAISRPLRRKKKFSNFPILIRKEQFFSRPDNFNKH